MKFLKLSLWSSLTFGPELWCHSYLSTHLLELMSKSNRFSSVQTNFIDIRTNAVTTQTVCQSAPSLEVQTLFLFQRKNKKSTTGKRSQMIYYSSIKDIISYNYWKISGYEICYSSFNPMDTKGLYEKNDFD